MPTDEEMVPRSRLTEKQKRIDELESKVATLEAGTKALPALQRQVETLTGQLCEARSNLALADAGVTDPDVRALVQWRHGQLPKKDRPELGEYLKGAALEDPLLKGHLVKPAEGGAGGDEKKADAGGEKKPAGEGGSEKKTETTATPTPNPDGNVVNHEDQGGGEDPSTWSAEKWATDGDAWMRKNGLA